MFEKPTEEELARRRRQIAETRQIRDRIGPIDIATDDLNHECREDELSWLDHPTGRVVSDDDAIMR